MKNKFLEWKPVYSTINLFWLLLFAEKEHLGKREQFYDKEEGYIYEWQMKIINVLKSRSDTWTYKAKE